MPISHYKPLHVFIRFPKNKNDKITIDNERFDFCYLENILIHSNYHIHYQ